jgi:PiT family inorganic phosphate transporter
MLLATIFGMPVSSSQSKSMAIAGVGSSRRLKSVNWNVIRGMLTAWIVTFPCCIFLGYVICKIIVGLV